MSDDFLLRLLTGLPVFLLAIVAHEWAHAFVALKFGDTTAKDQGRLTLNPMAHIDPFGTILWPLICAISPGGVMFGYAKPVPVNPSRFKNYKHGLFWVSFAGPAMNIILGIVSAFALALVAINLPRSSEWHTISTSMLQTSMIINFVLACFNLIPFPPLDGSKMVMPFLNYEQAQKYESLSRFALIFILILFLTPVGRYVLYPALLASQVTLGTFMNLLG